MQVNWPPHERPALFEQLKSLITEKRNPDSMEIDTDTKPILNMISTAAMIRLGKDSKNTMVIFRITNVKLVERSRRIVMIITGGTQKAGATLDAADGHVKTTLVMLLAEVDADEARARIEQGGGFVRHAIAGTANR